MSKTITREELRRRQVRGEDFELVNVLAPDSFRREHIPASVNVPRDQIESRAPRLWDKDRDIVVYCASFECQSSRRVARTLEKLGFSSVTAFEGGMADWKDAGYSVTGGEEAA